MRYLVALCFSVSAAGWLLPGCVADHASAIDESETKADFISRLPDEPANPADPFGACVDDPDDGVDDIACSIPGLRCSGAGDIGGPAGEGQREYARIWPTCTHTCEEDSQCPVPATGDAAPKCAAGYCVLPCDDEGTVCPDGFMCWNLSEISAWSSAYEDICVQYFSYEPFAPTSLDALGFD